MDVSIEISFKGPHKITPLSGTQVVVSSQ